MNTRTFLSLMGVALILLLPACTRALPELSAPVEPIAITGDLTSIELCEAIPQEDIEAVMGVKLVKPPMRYTLPLADGTSGCFYEGPTDSDHERHFGYVILTPLEVYESQTPNQKEEVSGLGEEAYFNKSGDTRQLWVKLNHKVAFVIGFGDVAKEEGSRALAELMIEALK